MRVEVLILVLSGRWPHPLLLLLCRSLLALPRPRPAQNGLWKYPIQDSWEHLPETSLEHLLQERVMWFSCRFDEVRCA
jgi:hypothetical protein